MSKRNNICGGPNNVEQRLGQSDAVISVEPQRPIIKRAESFKERNIRRGRSNEIYDRVFGPKRRGE